MSMGSMTSCESLLDADLGPSPAEGGHHQTPGGAGAGAGGAAGPPERVAIVGSGNWGSAIARIVGRNVAEQVRGGFLPTGRGLRSLLVSAGCHVCVGK